MGKLPKLYVNKISSKSVNNEEVFYSKNEEVKEDLMLEVDDKTKSVVNSLLIQKKLNDIFNSPNFVYKIRVKLNIKDEGVREVVLIAKNKDSVLTINNESILISDILEVNEV